MMACNGDNQNWSKSARLLQYLVTGLKFKFDDVFVGRFKFPASN